MGKRGTYSASEDTIVRRCVEAGVRTNDILPHLPGRSVASINARIQTLGLPSRRRVGPEVRRQHRNFTIEQEIGAAVQQIVNATDHTWSTFVRAAIIEKIEKCRERCGGECRKECANG